MKRKKYLSLLLAGALAFGPMANIPVQYVFANDLTIAERPEDGVTEDQPFAPGTGGSNLFRIPFFVTMDDGTLVAGCDARWTTILDGGGLDTIVSRSSDGGATWNYTFANFNGDNGNVHNTASTCFIDPAIATDGEKLYMIADLFPAGYALNGADHGPVAGQNGLDEDGNLRLSADGRSTYGYRLEKVENGTVEHYYNVVDKDGNVVDGYEVDAYFNIKGNDVDTNLFFANSPYLTYPTDYLYFTTSEDNGATWSIPSLINAKKPAEQVLLVGPGNGIVTSTGRLVFTVYEHTSGKEVTAAIYSDDGGKTWKRGESVDYHSSEATVAEVNGKLYMFTRNGSNTAPGTYYISEDMGETWSDRYMTEAVYNGRCQLSVIAYSKNINGKPALLLAAPASQAGRENGKIFIALVKDDGTLEFPNEFEINKGYYAYSCLDELKDGGIGLLYESDGAKITYREIKKEEIFSEVFVGNIWAETTEGETAKRSYDIKPGASMTLKVNHLLNETVQVSSDKPDAVEAILENGTLTITAKESVETLVPTTITLTDGTDTTTIRINVAPAESYEIIDLYTTGSTTVVNSTGDYSQEEIQGLDSNIAEIEMEGNVIAGGPRAQLAVGSGNFTGSQIALSDCYYTFTSSGTANTYTISGKTAEDATVYVNVEDGGASIPNMNASKNITLEKHQTDSTFALNNNGKYLFFHKDNNSKLHFDRNSSIHATNCYYELYQPSEDAPADAVVPGHVQVTSLDGVANGGKYLIVALANDGQRYVLHPSSGSSAHQHVAKVAAVEPDTHETFITITALKEGVTSAVIGETTYYINVDNEEKSLVLAEGTQKILAGKLVASPENQEVISIGKNVNQGPYERVSEITEGKYLLGNANSLVINEDSGLTGPNGLAMKAVNYEKGDHSQYMWTITPKENGYVLKGEDGKYMNFNGTNVTLSDTEQVLSIGVKDNNGFSVSNAGYFLNNWANTNNRAAAYQSDNNVWYFYQPAESYVLEALAPGKVQITIGGVNYQITVPGESDDEGNENQQEIQEAREALESVIFDADTKEQSEYTKESWATFAAALEAAKAEVAKEDATKESLEAAKATLETAMKDLAPAQGSEDGDGSQEDAAQKEILAAKENLDKVITSAAGKKEADYTKESWAAYQTALKSANDLKVSTTATKAELETAKVNLEKAIAGLKPAPQTPSGGENQGGQQEQQKEVQAAKDELNDVIKDVSIKDEVAYTTESYNVYQNAYKKAKSVLDNPKSTKEEIEAATSDLRVAFQGLKLVATQKPEEQKPAEVVKPGVTFENGTYQFKITSATEAQFTGVATSIKTVKIANTIQYGGKDLKVTSIANGALKGDKVVTKVVLGSNIKNIGNSAFENCSKLTSVNLKNVTKIGNKAFKKCTSLKKVTIPKKVTNLGKSVFEGCKKLSTITIKATGLKRVGKNTFKSISAKAKIKVPKKNLAKYKKILKNKGQGKKVTIK